MRYEGALSTRPKYQLSVGLASCGKINALQTEEVSARTAPWIVTTFCHVGRVGRVGSAGCKGGVAYVAAHGDCLGVTLECPQLRGIAQAVEHL